MKQGLILTNAFTQSESTKHQASRLKEEFNKLGVEIDVLPNDFFAANINDDGNITLNLKQYDFCVYLNKDKYISHMLEKQGLKLFNCHQAILDCDDKVTTFIVLSNNGIPMPKTFAGLLSYNPNDCIENKTIEHIENELGYPLIVKASYGSLGKDVYKANNKNELKILMTKLKNHPHLFQQYISSSHGKDMRVIVIGGKVVSAIIRQSTNGDFRSNLALGGIATAITPPKEVIKLCEKCAKILNLDYCGIDVLFGENKYYICEVNSNAYFEGSEKATKINIAGIYAKQIYDKIYKH